MKKFIKLLFTSLLISLSCGGAYADTSTTIITTNEGTATTVTTPPSANTTVTIPTHSTPSLPQAPSLPATVTNPDGSRSVTVVDPRTGSSTTTTTNSPINSDSSTTIVTTPKER